MGCKVLVTVGTTSFDALIKAVDNPATQMELKRLGYTDICYQVGTSSLKIRNKILRTRVVPFEHDFETLLKKSELIISHMGGGTIIDVFRLRKKAIFVPNPDVSGNHQVQLFRIMDGRFTATLETLQGKIAMATETPGDFFAKIFPPIPFNHAMENMLSQ